MENSSFWERLDKLVAQSPLAIDRPRGSAHPRYPNFLYPLDYGYLEGTSSGDAGAADVWVGSLRERRVTGIVCTVDAEKRDAEIKVLLGCTRDEARQILALHNDGSQSAILVEREAG